MSEMRWEYLPEWEKKEKRKKKQVITIREEWNKCSVEPWSKKEQQHKEKDEKAQSE